MAWLRTSRPVDALDGRLESRCVRNGCETVIGRCRLNSASPFKALRSKLDTICRELGKNRKVLWLLYCL